MKLDRIGNYRAVPYEQRACNALCSIYNIINAVSMIRGLTEGESQKLFSRIIGYLDETGALIQILTKGITFRTVEGIFDEVVSDQINRSLPFSGQTDMTVERFVSEMEKYPYCGHQNRQDKIILFYVRKMSDSWVVFRETRVDPEYEKLRIDFFNWYHWQYLEIDRCTTSETRSHKLYRLDPARTYLLW
jgi:hypothetical protein